MAGLVERHPRLPVGRRRARSRSGSRSSSSSGAVGGLLNGLLVARGGLPSLVVTLGTLALFRGLALIVLGPRGVSDFPPAFTELGFGDVPGTPIPWPFVIFLALAARARHRAPPDLDRPPDLRDRQERRDGALLRASASPASGIGLFVLSGTIAALAGVILTSRLSSARADAGRA